MKITIAALGLMMLAGIANAQNRPNQGPEPTGPATIAEISRCSVDPEALGPASIELRNGRLRSLVTRDGNTSMVFDFMPVAGVSGQSFEFEVLRGTSFNDPAQSRFQLAQTLPNGRIELRSWFLDTRSNEPRARSMILTCDPPRSQR